MTLSSLSIPLLEKNSYLNNSTGTRVIVEVSLTSAAFSKIALSNFSIEVIGDSPFGITLPTRISPGANTPIDYTSLI